MTTILSPTIYLVALIASIVALPALGQLTFEQSRISMPATPETEAVTANFTCTNSGKKPVKIVRIRTTCGCTTAQQAADRLAPGETTTIAVEMEIRIDAGTQRKAIIVEIDRAPFAYELEIEAVIPETLKVTPKHLTWVVGNKPIPRIIALTPDTDVAITTATSSDPNFTCELARHDDGWQLLVTPAQLKKRRFGKITISYQLDGQQLQREIPFAVIEPPAKPRSWLQRLFSSP